MAKNDFGHSGGHMTLKLAVSQKKKSKNFKNSGKVKVTLIILGSHNQNGCGILLGCTTLKYAASQDWVDVKSLFFAWWYKFSKAKNYFHNY